MSKDGHLRALGVTILLALGPAARTSGHAQTVVIPDATPGAVIERLATHLLGQGFKLERQDEAGALFTLDRGMVSQKYVGGVLLPIVVELTVRCKPVKRGLQVRLSEEVVAYRGQAKESRNPVRSHAELTNLTRLLELVRSELLAARPAVTRDSL